MGEFQRSPSKVWWLDEDTSGSWERRTSASPGSQDSGFSDTESSPIGAGKPRQDGKNKHQVIKEKTPEEIRKDISKNGTADKTQNLSSSIKEKSTPKKCLIRQNNSTSNTRNLENQEKKRNRNLFTNVQAQDSDEYCNNSNDQYAEGVDDNVVVAAVETHRLNKIKARVAREDTYSWLLNENSEIPEGVRSLPLIANARYEDFINLSAPANIDDIDETVTSFNQSLNSDCDSELEALFLDNIQSPQHTSTPKTPYKTEKIDLNRIRTMNLMLKYQNERVPPTIVNTEEEMNALDLWLKTIRQMYDPECMTALQCKSIAGDLQEKVNLIALQYTDKLREIIGQSRLIEREVINLHNQSKHIKPLAQSVVGLIIEYFKKYFKELPPNIERFCNEIRSSNNDLIKNIESLYNQWKFYQKTLIENEVNKFVEEMEDPKSEMHVRGMITALTTLTLPDEELVNIFVSSGAVQILVVLCEKCEGSTVRALALRALSTICVHCIAIRHFEKAQGVQMIAEILSEDSRPEPERSEAAALLAQVTAPWIEDNHSVKGLDEVNKKLVKALTRFLKKTKCCQNLLLCTAALANLSTMNNKSIHYILKNNTAQILLEGIKRRGSRVSIYLLEQASTLIANMSSIDEGRQELTQCNATFFLLCFLRASYTDEEVVKRLQQKSIIALSKLSSDKVAAKQIVENDGVEKLVKLCREKEERHGNDAVLVASLATLRKIAESCGYNVIRSQDVQELVEPRLLDSFLAYSSQNESYV